MAVDEKQFAEALQLVAEQMHSLETALAKLQAGLLAAKAMLALQMDPAHPRQALKRIQDLEDAIVKRDPSAATRQRVSEVFEMLKILDKHGGPKQA